MSKGSNIGINDLIGYVQDLYRFGLKNFKVIALFSIIGGALGFTYAYMKKPTYNAYLSFFVNENDNAMSLSLSSLSSLANLGGGGSGSVNEDKLVFIAASRYIIGTTLLSEVNTGSKKEMLVNMYIDNTKMYESFPADTSLKDFRYFKNTTMEALTYQENKVLDKIIKIIRDANLLKVEMRKKTGIVAQNAGIITIEFVSGDETFTKLFLDRLYHNLSTYYISRTTSRQYRNYNLIKHRADSLKTILSGQENFGAELVDRNTNMAKMAARLQVERTRKNVEILNLMYAEVLKNLELAKFTLENQTPMFQLIDSPTYPLKLQKKSKIVFGALGFVVAGLLTLCVLLVKNGFFGSREKEVVE